MKAYQKLMLLLYPKLGRMAEDIKKMIESLAGVCGGNETAEQSVQKILDYMYVRDCFIVLKAELDEVFVKLEREERYLLEYKYFRRKKVLSEEFADMQMNCSERTYFRRQNRLAEKINSLLMQSGLSEAWFNKTFSCVPYVMAALEKVRESGERGFLDKRIKTDLHFSGAESQKTSSCSSL